MADETPRPQDDRTEAATPRRLQRAREEGQAPLSREVVTLAVLAGFALLALVVGPALLRDLTSRLRLFLTDLDAQALAGAEGWRIAGLTFLFATLPVLLAVLAGGVGATLAQTGFMTHAGALRPKAGRINPLSGLRRLVGVENLVDTLRALAKLALVTLGVWWALPTEPGVLTALPFQPLGPLLDRTGAIVWRILLAVILAQTLIAGLDLLWVRMRHARGLRMSRQDLQEELKETEGDPRIRARLRQIRQQRARRRMLAEVAKATVVITNPTHYAVALAYDRSAQAAPKLVAKGVDAMAARIREVATEHRVPMVTNPPLARALHRLEYP
jgi:flagellar biosynthetic protein FlhB